MKNSVEKLEGANNWSRWRRQIELVLRHQEVLDVVNGSRTEPGEPTEEAGRIAFNTELKAFKKADALA